MGCIKTLDFLVYYKINKIKLAGQLLCEPHWVLQENLCVLLSLIVSQSRGGLIRLFHESRIKGLVTCLCVLYCIRLFHCGIDPSRIRLVAVCFSEWLKSLEQGVLPIIITLQFTVFSNHADLNHTASHKLLDTISFYCAHHTGSNNLTVTKI